MSEHAYFVRNRGRVVGPMDLEQMREARAAGEVWLGDQASASSPGSAEPDAPFSLTVADAFSGSTGGSGATGGLATALRILGAIVLLAAAACLFVEDLGGVFRFALAFSGACQAAIMFGIAGALDRLDRLAAEG